MHLYLARRTDEMDYDEYGGFVIVANTPTEARKMANKKQCGWYKIDRLGKSVRYKKPEIILGSFVAD